MPSLKARHGAEFVHPTPDETAELHRACTEFMRAAPWEPIDDGHVIVHEHPEHPTTYSVIFGRQGIARGFNIFIGETGLYNLTALLRGGLAKFAGMPIEDKESIRLDEAEVIIGLAADRNEMTPAERQRIREAGIRYRGNGNWAQIRRATTGYIPHETDQAETRYTGAVLHDIVHVAAKIRQGDLDPKRWVNFAHFLHSTFGHDRWEHSWRKPPSPPPIPHSLEVPVEDLLGLERREDMWFIGEVTPGTAHEPTVSHRPFPVKVMAIVDGDIGLVRGMEPGNGPTSYTSRQQALRQAIMRAGFIPQMMVAHEAYTAVAAAPICEALQIQMGLTDSKHEGFNIPI